MSEAPTPPSSKNAAKFSVWIFAGIVVVMWFAWPALRQAVIEIPPLETPSPATSSTPDFPSPTSTSTELAPVTIEIQNTPLSSPPSPTQGTGGGFLVSMGDGVFQHIIAYYADGTPAGRVTNDPWDDIHPALSPDGSRLAYSSRRNGYWDIYLLDLTNGDLTRITDTPDYEGSPTWSPDGQWLAFERSNGNNLDIFIQSLADLSQPAIQLTDDPAADFSPSWSPLGREIAFVSNRTGDNEVFTARLDLVDNRFTNISNNPSGDENDPAWAPDGLFIAWTGIRDGTNILLVQDIQNLNNNPIPLGYGENAAWDPNGQAILVSYETPNSTFLTGYSVKDNKILIPLISLPAKANQVIWLSQDAFDHTLALAITREFKPVVLYETVLTPPASSSLYRLGLVAINDVDAPFAFLNDAVNEAYEALRAEAARQSGWDVLANLENAYIPLTEPPHPGGVDAWLQTGRGISLNPLPIQAGWMVVVREDFGGQTFWRLFIKTRYQDGSQGVPMKNQAWNLDLRYAGDPQAFEQGGAQDGIPTGYWMDLTELAGRYGWTPIPALQNWRTFYPAARFNQLVYSEGLDLQSALEQLYPPEAILPPTLAPTLTLTPSLTPTLWSLRTATPAPLPSETPVPTRRPTWTPLPGDPLQ